MSTDSSYTYVILTSILISTGDRCLPNDLLANHLAHGYMAFSRWEIIGFPEADWTVTRFFIIEEGKNNGIQIRH